MKIRMKEEMLKSRVSVSAWQERGLLDSEGEDKQAKNTPEDDNVKVEEVGDSDCEAEDYGYHAGPEGGSVSFVA